MFPQKIYVLGENPDYKILMAFKNKEDVAGGIAAIYELKKVEEIKEED